MSHERYTEEQRMSTPFRNPEWYALRGVENRYPNQFGKQESQEQVFLYIDPVVVPSEIFPIETGEPIRETR